MVVRRKSSALQPQPSPLTPSGVFRRIWVSRSPGYVVVQWELGPRFLDPKPHQFQLQVAPTSQPAETDWVNVGPSADTGYLVDDESREHGKTFDHVYRVVLTTPFKTYKSNLTYFGPSAENTRDRRIGREVLRQLTKRASKFTGTAGFLMKRRRYGLPCETCLDPHSGEPTRSDCPECYGTRLSLGYHAAGYQILYATQGLAEYREDVSENLTEGTVKPFVTRTEMHGFPYINSLDVWVSRDSGRRWLIQKVLETSSLRDTVLTVDVEARWLPLSDIIYTIPMESGS